MSQNRKTCHKDVMTHGRPVDSMWLPMVPGPRAASRSPRSSLDTSMRAPLSRDMAWGLIIHDRPKKISKNMGFYWGFELIYMDFI